MVSIQIVLSVLAFVAVVSGGAFKMEMPKEKLHSIPLTFRDNYYFGTVALGSNNQIFRVLFETAETETWIPSAKCNKTNISCQLHNQYDALASITSKVTDVKFEKEYLPFGHFEGNYVYDYIVLSDLVVPIYEFAEVVIEPIYFDTVLIDGIFGLGLILDSNFSDTSIMNSLFLEGLIDEPYVGIYLSKDIHEGGEIVFGGYNKEHIKSDINFLNSTSKYIWSVESDSVNFGDLELSPGNVVLSSGSLMISGPYMDIAQIHDAINAVKRQDGIYIVNCDKVSSLPVLDLEIGGVTYSLKPADYIVKKDYEFNEVCESTFLGLSIDNWILGIPFFRNYYTIFDYDNYLVGLANSK